MNGVKVNPSLLHWARERSGRSANYLQKYFPRLQSWERGESRPSLKRLEAFAKATYTPIGYFFLQEPPGESLPIDDLRTVGDRSVSAPSPHLLDTIYLCQQRQHWYLNEVQSVGDEPLGFVGSLDTTEDIISSAGRMRDELGFSVEQRKDLPTWVEALRQFIEQVEDLGILVMISGVVGNSNTRKLDVNEFRGFALTDRTAPVVFINGSDSKAAQMFTLAHEIAHIWLGQSGVSNLPMMATARHTVEDWCNSAAAELLVPSDMILSEYDRSSDLSSEINRLAKIFKVSTLVVLRRIRDTGRLDRDQFQKAYHEEVSRLNKLKSSGGNFYPTIAARASKRFVRTLIASTMEGRTTMIESMRLLHIRNASTIRKIGLSLGVGR